MRTPTLLFAIWCACVAALFVFANSQAWSPFASGRAAPRGGGVGGVIITGPNHK